jgi:hypothetical protein
MLQELADYVESVPRYRLDLGIALREGGKILATLGQLDEARAQLENSRSILSRLISEDPANEHFTQQLPPALYCRINPPLFEQISCRPNKKRTETLLPRILNTDTVFVRTVSHERPGPLASLSNLLDKGAKSW